jgi:hypothetical protein
MRYMAALTALLMTASLTIGAAEAASAYKWCASSEDGENCYFTSLNQCLDSISGNLGVCFPSPY